MSTIDDIIEAVHDNLPHYNRDMLVEFPRREIGTALRFVDTCMREGVLLNPGAIEYEGYEVLSPEEQAKQELVFGRSGQQKISTVFSELILVRFKFKHNSRDGIRRYESYMYIPFLHDDFLIYNGRRLGLRKGIAEKVFIRDTDPGKYKKYKIEVDNLLVNPIRVKVKFRRDTTHTLRSAKDGSAYRPIFVTVAKAHTREHKKRKVGTTIILHLLAKHGFNKTVESLGFSPNDFEFVDAVDQSDHDHDYFEAKNGFEGHSRMFYMKVPNEKLKDRLFRKTTAEIIYLLSNFGFQHKAEVRDESGSIWRTMLGKVISQDDDDLKAREEANNHILSADSFLDPLTRERYRRFGVDVKDFYDLLRFVYIHIDEIIVNTPPQNLYNRALEISHSMFISAYAKFIFHKFYKGNQKSQLKDNEVSSILRFDAKSIEHPYSGSRGHGGNSMEVITVTPTIYGSNWLVGVGIHKMRRAGRAEQLFHPSMFAVESGMALSGKDSAKSGHLNPFLEIDMETGAIRQDLMPWTQDVDNLLRWIPLM